MELYRKAFAVDNSRPKVASSDEPWVSIMAECYKKEGRDEMERLAIQS